MKHFKAINNAYVDYLMEMERRGIIEDLAFEVILNGYYDAYFTVVNKMEYETLMFG